VERPPLAHSGTANQRCLSFIPDPSGAAVHGASVTCDGALSRRASRSTRAADGNRRPGRRSLALAGDVRHGALVPLTRLRMDELVNAWVADEYTPFQIALLGVFDATPFLLPDGVVDVPRIQAELAVRARRVPALGRRVVWTRLGEGLPVWAPDPEFEPERHIEGATLPPGADLPDWAANRVVRPLPLDRPLWRAEVVDGLPGQQFAVLVVVHHIAADGIAGVALAGSLLDGSPGGSPTPDPLPGAPPLPSHRDLLRDRRDRAVAALRRARPPDTATLRRLRDLARQVRDASSDLRTRTSETSLPRRVGRERRLVVVRQPLDDLRRTGHSLGVTVNDLLLAAVTGGLRDLLRGRGDDVEALRLRTSVPAASGVGGQASGILLVDLPVAEPDPLQRLAQVHRATVAAKGKLYAGAPDVTDVLHLPVPLARLGLRWMRRFGGSRVNLFVTDVPGPPTPLWLAGARLVEAVPVAPLVQRVGLGVAALSYAGDFAVSLHADGSVTDLPVLAEGVAASFACFHRAAVVKPGPRAAAVTGEVRATPRSRLRR
jgi:diacylglycerol O-acyltransferase